MTEPNNIVLEHLCHIRGAIDDLREDPREMNRLDRMDIRIGRIERRLDLTNA
jgi:hypothetical protein